MKHKKKDVCANPDCAVHGDLENMTDEERKIVGISRAIYALAAIREIDPSDLCDASTTAILSLCALYLDKKVINIKGVQSKMKDECLTVYKRSAQTGTDEEGVYFKLSMTLDIVQGMPSGKSLQ